MESQRTILVFGGTGQTGRHLTDLALAAGHRVRVLARTPAKAGPPRAGLDVRQGSVTDDLDFDGLLDGVDSVVSLLGDVQAQRTAMVNTAFVRRLVPAMRRTGVRRFLYQAGALSAPPHGRLTPVLWVIRNTIARSYDGQHRDNEAVMRYLADEAMDLEWMVHRAGIGSDGPSKGVLEPTEGTPGIGTFGDCATYDLRLLADPSAVHTTSLSAYRKTAGRKTAGRKRADRWTAGR
ncbi:NAD(P)-dependent oxidoreductase [Curtobacterium sp. MCBD17_030]|uniref:NAD(P)-dependent oxidoreductase n=1 Tax=Curtobacterium sp. MCBD17_030 TaxID=2175649 RepID=UPI000D97F076|nr:NAD(P)H-binding protein [Curtobacterium sp. MCBD17_030]PYY36413.1 NmrA family transcriptional regulator [Curtobacterium sp. MCBD17_030]